MNEHAVVIPYDVSMQYVQGRMRRIYHDFKDWGDEIVIVLDGKAVFHLNDHSFPIQRGDVFVLRGDYYKEITGAERLRFCSIYFHETDIQRLAGTFRWMKGYQSLFIYNPLVGAYEPDDFLHADEDLLDDLQHILERMLQEQKLKEVGFEQILNSSFFILITLLSRAVTDDDRLDGGQENDFAHAVAFMQSRYAEPIRIPQLAKIAHLSERQFNRRFKALYEVTPSQFLFRLRMERACALLEESTLSISDIAMSCGFSDINYFSSSFKTLYGISASQYRHDHIESIKKSDIKRHRPKKDNN